MPDNIQTLASTSTTIEDMAAISSQLTSIIGGLGGLNMRLDVLEKGKGKEKPRGRSISPPRDDPPTPSGGGGGGGNSPSPSPPPSCHSSRRRSNNQQHRSPRRSIKPPKSEFYSGNASKLELWICQLDNYFKLLKEDFSGDETAKVIFALSCC